MTGVLDQPCSDGNAYAHLRAAASGDLMAMRRIVAIGMEGLREQPDIIAAAETLVFARMAAIVGDLSDSATLLCLVGVLVDLLDDQPLWAGYRAELQGEGTAVISRLADAGVDAADKLLPAIVADMSPEVSVIAKDIANRMAAI